MRMEPACEAKRPGWREWLPPLAAVALWCAPAAAINITHGSQVGNEPAITFLSIMAVFFTALCALCLEQRSGVGIRLLAAILVAAGITYNLSNAIGLVAGHSEQKRSTALTQQGVRQSLSADLSALQRQIAPLDAMLGDASAPSIKAQIAELERHPIFDRSSQCADATLPDSRSLCAERDKAQQSLKAARQRETLRARLAAINAKLRAAPVRESADPKAEAITKALGFVGVHFSTSDVRYALILLPAILAELMAAFGAAMCGARLPELFTKAERKVTQASYADRGKAIELPEARGAPELHLSGPLPKSQDELIARFLCDHIIPGEDDSSVRSSDLYMTFKSWWICHAADSPLPSRIALGQAMSARGFERSKRGGISRYENVRLVPLGTN